MCLRSDRASLYEQWDLPLADALRVETEFGIEALPRAGEALDGAERASPVAPDATAWPRADPSTGSARLDDCVDRPGVAQ